MTAQLPSRKRLELLANPKLECTTFSKQERAAMARALLAPHEQEPVAWIIEDEVNGIPQHISSVKEYALAYPERKVTPLYIHPAPVHAVQDNWKGQLTGTQCTPESVSKLSTGTSVGVAIVPAVPDEVPEWLKDKLLTICDMVEDNDEYCQDTWNACRAAMLNGGKS